MPVKIRIEFDNNVATYYAGQTISGRVYVSLDKPKRVRAITCKVKGEAAVQWHESTKRFGRDERQRYSAKETYYENKYFLYGKEDGDVVLAQGEYIYPFSSRIPANAPSSFEGSYGHIRYTVNATLDRPWRFDSVAKAAFTVVAPLDLNGLPQAKEPIEIEKNKHFGCLWWKSGPLTMTVQMPTKGYVPGQKIPLQFEIENASNVPVRQIACELRKDVLFHARSPRRKTKMSHTKVAECFVDAEVLPHTKGSFSHDLIVPSLPPSNLANCSIIDLDYMLKIDAVVGGLHLNLVIKTTLLLGTIPLLTGPTAYKPEGRAPGLTPTPLVPSGGGGWNLPVLDPGAPETPPPAYSLAPNAPPQYPDLPPPSYEESILKGNNIRDASDNEYTMGIQDFTPRYPVWSFGPVGPASPVAPETKN